MIRYVCGIAFNETVDSVALIRKQKPVYLAGRLTGIGGKIEPGESHINAMVREFREEAGVLWDNWTLFANMRGAEHEVFFFKAALPYGVFGKIYSVEAEQIETYFLKDIPHDQLVSNMRWLIPMALDRHVQAAWVNVD